MRDRLRKIGWPRRLRHPRQMRLDPGVHRRGTIFPNIKRHAGEDELVFLAPRAAAQALFVPVDPDVPILPFR